VEPQHHHGLDNQNCASDRAMGYFCVEEYLLVGHGMKVGVGASRQRELSSLMIGVDKDCLTPVLLP
jgi:hypothetical protein